MADFNPAINPLFLRDEELRRGMEMLFLAWRNVAECADETLAAHGLGRAHHRAIYFIGRSPGITVGDLLDRLGITKQSLSRVIRQLAEQDFITVDSGLQDRRQRRLSLTPQGEAVERESTEAQRALFASAYRQAGAEAVEGFRQVLSRLAG
jgi:DNA-binding MarR family transcriptional regulator